ncbi:MAG: Bug family tripartite tricarboxylate transporter substrate binding protein [Xanthobacteraceae bacterium]
MRSLFAAAGILLAAVGSAPQASAQSDFPNHPIRLFVGFPPGGSTDVLSRTLAQEARQALGQEVVVINKPGATGALAAIEVANSPADGYTIGVTPSSTMTLAHQLQSIRADLLESTSALISVGSQRTGMAVKTDSDIASFKDLIERARKEPGKISIGVPGSGTMSDLMCRSLFREAGVDINIVPFNGDAPVATAVLGGHVSAGSFSAGGWNPLIAAGKMRLIASMEQERAEIAPDVPTLIEQGYSIKGGTIQYMFAPKGLPPAVFGRLFDVFYKASKSPVYVEIAKQNALYDDRLIAGGPLDTYLLNDRNKDAALVEKLGLKKN